MTERPLDQKAYGSIPHLQTSKRGTVDNKIISPGQEKILTKKVRDRHDEVIVTEKVDGSCVAIVLHPETDQLVPVSRTGYHVRTAPYRFLRSFESWVSCYYDDFYDILHPGWRVVGEWMVQAHGMKYDMVHKPFIAFDIFDENNERLHFFDMTARIQAIDQEHVGLVHYGEPIAPDKLMAKKSKHGAAGMPEGFVYKLERKKECEFMAKWVRGDFVPGSLLPEKGSNIEHPIWNRWIDPWESGL